MMDQVMTKEEYFSPQTQQVLGDRPEDNNCMYLLSSDSIFRCILERQQWRRMHLQTDPFFS